tara:strand:- start:4419 stop:4601 length:183 start_codon:yes stop_codon:yes gene_type:complete
MEIKDAQYMSADGVAICAINATIDGVPVSVPMDPANRHYEEILRQVKAGELTIKEVDKEE